MHRIAATILLRAASFDRTSGLGTEKPFQIEMASACRIAIHCKRATQYIAAQRCGCDELGIERDGMVDQDECKTKERSCWPGHQHSRGAPKAKPGCRVVAGTAERTVEGKRKEQQGTSASSLWEPV